jgi:hypothetical protein
MIRPFLGPHLALGLQLGHVLFLLHKYQPSARAMLIAAKLALAYDGGVLQGQPLQVR